VIPWEAAGGLVAAAGALAYGTYAPNCRLFGPVTGHGRGDSNHVYLTFDDGPNPVATARILDTLAAEAVPAAFFQVAPASRVSA